jgi:hypothetical protein
MVQWFTVRLFVYLSIFLMMLLWCDAVTSTSFYGAGISVIVTTAGITGSRQRVSVDAVVGLAHKFFSQVPVQI